MTYYNINFLSAIRAFQNIKLKDITKPGTMKSIKQIKRLQLKLKLQNMMAKKYLKKEIKFTQRLKMAKISSYDLK